MDSGSPDAAALRRVGLGFSTSRLAVHAALAANAPPGSVEAVVSAMRERLGGWLGPDHVQRAAHVGLVRRVEPAGRPFLYEPHVGDNDHHIVYRHYDAMADIDCAVGDTPGLTSPDDSGYEIDEAQVVCLG